MTYPEAPAATYPEAPAVTCPEATAVTYPEAPAVTYHGAPAGAREYVTAATTAPVLRTGGTGAPPHNPPT